MYLNMSLPIQFIVGVFVARSEILQRCYKVTRPPASAWSRVEGTYFGLDNRISCYLWLYLCDCRASRAAVVTTNCSASVM